MTFTESVSPACILRDNSKFHSKNCFVAGWGKTQEYDYYDYTMIDATILRSTNVVMNTEGPCRVNFRDDFNPLWRDVDFSVGQVCAAGGDKEH